MVTKGDTGCRPAELFGEWAAEPERFQRLVASAMRVDLRTLAESRAAARGDSPSPARAYEVDADGIATITLAGPFTKYETSFQSLFGGTATVRARRAVRESARDPQVRGIMLVVDSPGGTVSGTADLADDVHAAAQRKPLHAYIEDVGASAAYWVASQAQRVTAGPSAVVGSIGVYTVLHDTSGAYAQEGVRVHVVASAPAKGAGVDGTPITPDQIDDVQRRVNEISAVFTGAIARGRRMSSADAQQLADGKVYVGAAALARRLVDGVESLDSARSHLLEVIRMAEEQTSAAALADQVSQLRVALEQAQRDTATLTAQAADASRRAAIADMRDRVRTAYAALPTTVAGVSDLAAWLVDVEGKLDDGQKAGLHGLLAACNGLLAADAAGKRGPFSQIGSDALPATGGTATEELRGRAKKLQAEGKAPSYALAYELACTQDPALAQRAMQGEAA